MRLHPSLVATALCITSGICFGVHFESVAVAVGTALGLFVVTPNPTL